MKMTNKQFEIKKRNIEEKLRQQQMKRELRKLKWSWLPKIKKPNTSKLIVFITFVICLQILWFAEHMVSMTGDTSYMYVLLGVPVSLIPVTLGYMQKSKQENLADSGFIYEVRMNELNHQNHIEQHPSNVDQEIFYDEDEVDDKSDETGSVG